MLRLTYVSRKLQYSLRLASYPFEISLLHMERSSSLKFKSLSNMSLDHAVQLQILDQHVVMNNGLVQVTLSNPTGFVTGICYGGFENLLEVRNKESNRGYWDLDWGGPDDAGGLDRIKGTIFEIIVENEDQVEISFKRLWDESEEGEMVPLNIDKRFIMVRGSRGFYTYALYEHIAGWPPFSIGQTRIVFKLQQDKFHYMAMSDSRQRHLPLPQDRRPPRGQALIYPEAVRLVYPTDPNLQGEVDDKYQYCCDNKDNKVHGWISIDPTVGFWVITPSDEFRSGGPLKQNLTSHTGPTSLAMFWSSHYAGKDLSPRFESEEGWKRVFGPIFVYVNSVSSNAKDSYHLLWEDAKSQMMHEVESWPFDFVSSPEYAKADDRGEVHGRLLVRDLFVSHKDIPAQGAYVGLAPPGEAGSWQRESKNYQFWSNAFDDGSFSIKKVRPGEYNLYAWVSGFIGDYKSNTVINISPKCSYNLGNLVFEPPRDGPTLWEIGIPDRTAEEFYIPDPDPDFINKLYIHHHKFRQYGLWDRYTDLFPNGDLVYTVGVSDYQKDWFFAHVNRRVGDTYEGTTWQIKFKLDHFNPTGIYKLRIAIAAAHNAELQVRVNEAKGRPLFSSGLIGKENAIARHGIHGLYRLYHVDFIGAKLVKGDNIVFLTQPRGVHFYRGFMYDYLRLEAPMKDS